MRLQLERPLPDDLVCDLFHPRVRPESLDAALLELVRVAVPDAPDEVVDDAVSFTTDDGWRGVWIIVGGNLVARFDMLHFVAGAIVTSPTRRGLTEASPEVLACLRSARPDFSDEPPGLAALWR